MNVVSSFTYYNAQTRNNISGITYYASGTEKGKNNTPYHFVFAHATGFCKEIFVDVVRELRERGVKAPITSVDHPNHGDSTHNLPVDWHLAAADLYCVIDNVIRPNDPKKILVGVGHSMGGTVSAIVEVTHPGTYGCLILLEPVLPPPPYERADDTELSRMTLKRRDVFPDKESAKKSFSLKFPFNLWTQAALDSYVEHGFKPSLKDGQQVVVLKCSKEEEAEHYRMGVAHGTYDLVAQIQIPMLILKGTESTFLGGTYDALLKKSKTGKYGEIQGGSHFFPMEKPAEVAEKTLNFVKMNVNTGLESKL